MKKNIFTSSILTPFVFIMFSKEVYADMGNYGMMGGGYGGLFMWIIPLLVIVTLVLFIIWLLKQIQKK
ncbi:MAG: hypothetical protein KKG59_00175 [Nanoarchaeota archaeon]|nr:hypothetical protein [Nanoarchaeota archaeon]